MIVRDPRRAADEEFDLVVVGGGIYGASLLREAARRGVSACLCEAQDFGGVTSQNSLRILHGGLRYLQTLDLRRFFQSVAARRSAAGFRRAMQPSPSAGGRRSRSSRSRTRTRCSSRRWSS